MTVLRPSRKFLPQLKRIRELEKSSDRFRRVYSEYETITDELWKLENTDTSNIPDDFLDAVKLQAEYLEDEVGDWLLDDER